MHRIVTEAVRIIVHKYMALWVGKSSIEHGDMLVLKYLYLLC